MNKRFLTVLVLIGVLIASLIWYAAADESGTDDNAATENMMIEDNDPSNDDDDMIDKTEMESDASSAGGQQEDAFVSEETTHRDYSLYAPEVLANGRTKVLFFYAAWCPVCRAAEAKIKQWYKHDEPELPPERFDELPAYSMYKVDYDTETSLKSRFGVTYQHTFVLVDGEGNAIRTIQGPTDAELKALIAL